MLLSELETPCLVLDRTKFNKNLARVHGHLSGLGVKIRPHGKTAKSIDVMRPVLQGLDGGLTVSTLKEAEYYFEGGVRDITYAVGIAPVKLPRVARLIKKGCGLSIIMDTAEQARMASEKGQALGVSFPCLIEIDSDGHRAGVAPGDPLLLEIGRILHQEPGVELRGVLTHAGESYFCKDTEAIIAMAAKERDAAVGCAQALKEAGLPCPVISVGSTPTASLARDLGGVSEARPGVYVFQDLVQVGLGLCGIEDIAVSVLTSIIGYQKKKGWLICDAGWMALAQDRGTAKQAVDQGYGLVCDINGKPFGDLIVIDANQEHGIIAHRDGQMLDYDQFHVGDMLRVLPNHACPTAAMHDKYNVVDGGLEIAAQWPRINGW